MSDAPIVVPARKSSTEELDAVQTLVSRGWRVMTPEAVAARKESEQRHRISQEEKDANHQRVAALLRHIKYATVTEVAFLLDMKDTVARAILRTHFPKAPWCVKRGKFWPEVFVDPAWDCPADKPREPKWRSRPSNSGKTQLERHDQTFTRWCRFFWPKFPAVGSEDWLDYFPTGHITPEREADARRKAEKLIGVSFKLDW